MSITQNTTPVNPLPSEDESFRADVDAINAAMNGVRKNFRVIGARLLNLMDTRSYRRYYKSFGEFTLAEFGITENYAYKIVRAIKDVDGLLELQAPNPTSLTEKTVPGYSPGGIERASERQVRELRRLPAEQQAELAQTLDFDALSSMDVKKVVDDRLRSAKPRDTHPLEWSENRFRFEHRASCPGDFTMANVDAVLTDCHDDRIVAFLELKRPGESLRGEGCRVFRLLSGVAPTYVVVGNEEGLPPFVIYKFDNRAMALDKRCANWDEYAAWEAELRSRRGT